MPQYARNLHMEYDQLSDLPTMMYFRHYAPAYISAGKRRGHDVYLVYFNLENFSVFNERYGFEEGDKLLRFTSLAIRMAFPGYLAARVSADHFLLVCESLNVEEGILEIRDQLHVFGRHANVELKAGILLVSKEDDLSIGAACDYAKAACDSIAGRYDRTYRWYDESLAWRMEQQHYIESHIDRAVDEGWVRAYFQPIVRSLTGEVCEFEVLARWNDPTYGLLSPGVFIDVLEKARLIHKLDTCVVRLACKEWRRLSSTGDHWRVPLSVNLSRLDFELIDVFEMVEQAVQEYSVPRQMLHVEVTESALNENSGTLMEEVDHFRSAGYQVWLDDFGSGYSSLNTLKDFVFDVVKIDMAFLREFESKPQSRVIISSIVNMAKQLGMQTLIEGVETPEQFDFLRGIGCEFMQGFLIGRPVPNEQNVQRILSGELVLEKSSWHGYYDRIGRVNTLSAKPFEFAWERHQREVFPSGAMPFAIVEREMGNLRFMTVSTAFMDALKSAGMGSPAEMIEVVSKRLSANARLVYDALEAATNSGKVESVDFIYNGRHCIMRARHIASRDGVDAFLTSVMSLVRFADVDKDRRSNIALRCLYTVYDQVSVVDLKQYVGATMYRGNAALPAMFNGDDAHESILLFSERLVHPDDKGRFLEFFDMPTVAKRIEAEDKGRIVDAFRVLEGNGVYQWMTVVLVLGEDEGLPVVIVCVRRTNREVVQTIVENNTIPKALLWDTLVDLVPMGVFWKDADRRFVGVNKQFLDFYEFSSTNDVLGKNDEEMGWHVDADPFKNNEIRVVELGESVLDVPGTCISRGEVHNIRASKVPLKRNGKTVGLLGFFMDEMGETKAEDADSSLARFGRTGEIDQLTGIPNMRGLLSSAVSYEDAYKETGIDFVYVLADITDMGGLNKVYGRSFGNRIIKTVAQTLTKARGVTGVVARIGGDKFAMVQQVKSADDAKAAANMLRDTVTAIREVDGISVDLVCSLGWALNSERPDVASVIALANERLDAERNRA